MSDSQSEPVTNQHERQQWAAWLVEAAERQEDGRDQPPAEPHHDGAIHLLDLIAAVDYLTRGHRHGLTVWDALEEALRWWVTDQELLRHGAPGADTTNDLPASVDPLKNALGRFLAELAEPDAPAAAGAVQQAIRRWTTAMAERHNVSHHWPHPTPRRSFPPSLQATPPG